MLKASAGLQQVPKTCGVVEARSLTILMPFPVIGHKISRPPAGANIKDIFTSRRMGAQLVCMHSQPCAMPVAPFEHCREQDLKTDGSAHVQ
jgi:hypothetical protein